MPDRSLTMTHREWCNLFGMRPGKFSEAFYHIGTSHYGHAAYIAARLTGREFWSFRYRRYVFYSMEITISGGPCIVRRNAPHFALRMAELGQQPRQIELVGEMTGPKTRARADARDFIRKIESMSH